jgi:hypothetical protein
MNLRSSPRFAIARDIDARPVHQAMYRVRSRPSSRALMWSATLRQADAPPLSPEQLAQASLGAQPQFDAVHLELAVLSPASRSAESPRPDHGCF